jgi:hypothetical protein
MVLFPLAVAAQQTASPVTNADIIRMVKSGQPEATIVSTITSHETQFDLSATGLQGLNQAGVSSKVIRAMLAAESKRKQAAEAAASPAQNSEAASPPQEGASADGQMPQMNMPPDMMAQMQNMPPEMRQRMEAAMAQHGGRSRSGGGAASPGPARSLPGRAGVPVPLDSPLYTSFERLKAQGSYRMVMNMQSNDPRYAQIMAQGTFTPGQLIVQGNTRQFSMHMKIPATDVPGTVDDWEIRAVVQNGQAASLITSPAVPRLLKLSEEKAAQQLAMLDAMAANAVAHAAVEGPLGAIGAGMTVAMTALAHVEVPKMLKKEREMFSWRCKPAPKSGGPGGQSSTQLTDFQTIGDQMVDGRAATAYEFYAYDNEKTQGMVHLYVAKDSGLPLRIEMGDPSAGGGMQMNYGELTSPVNIEIPACMSGK